MASQEPEYKVKQIVFKGRRVPIMLQDVNGPCPLLAIANVLLLRNQLQLPAGAAEMSQSRLVDMVAGRLLDANSLDGPEEGRSAGAPASSSRPVPAGRQRLLSEEQRLSLQHNLDDAIALLPKLTTGIDVNLRFHDIRGFEYTRETAVFDLLDIPLVHGWLLDPQDEATARAVGTKSYNELVVQVVTTLGSTATPKHLTPTASLLRQRTGEGMGPPSGGSHTAPEAAAAASARSGGAGAAVGGSTAQQPGPLPAAAGQAPRQQGQQGQQQQAIDAEALSAALQQTLNITLQQQGALSTSALPPEQQQLPLQQAQQQQHHQQEHEQQAQRGSDAEGWGSGSPSARSASALALPGLAESSRATSNVSMQTTDSMHSMVNRMLTAAVSDAFRSPAVTPCMSMSTGHGAFQETSTTIPAATTTTTTTTTSSPGGAGAGGRSGIIGEEEGETTSALRVNSSSTSGSSGDLAAGAAAAAGGVGRGAVAEHPAAYGAPAAQLSVEWQVDLVLHIDETAAAAAGERPVHAELAVRQVLPLSLFHSTCSGELDALQHQQQQQKVEEEPQAEGEGDGQQEGEQHAVAHSTPATPHPSSASITLEDTLQRPAAAPAATAAAATPAPAPAVPGSNAGGLPSAPAGPGSNTSSASGSGSAASSAAPAAAAAPPAAATSAAAEEASVRDALLVQQFLECNPSQLSYHGLLQLQEGLRPNQLAVFFRNNHFNTLYKGPGDQLFILATDEGFLYEPDVVWEHLISVDGDTQLVDAAFRPFQPHASHQDAQAAAVVAQDDADWAAAAAAAGVHSHDADLALAMQLQAEEEERVQEEQQRRQQLAARQQEEQQRRQQQAQGQVLPSQRGGGQQGAVAAAAAGGAGKKKKEKKSTDSCTIM